MTRWLIVEGRDGKWLIQKDTPDREPLRILCTLLSEASAQEMLDEYHAGLWNAVIPF